MGATVGEYLRQLGSGRRADLPETTAGTMRLDAREDGHTEHWYLTIADQHVRVTQSGDDADLVIRAAPAALDRLARGETHVAAALLRNELSVQGKLQLLMLLRRIFPGPAGARHPRELGRAAMAGREGRR
ncbi:SCP2 sterol-binding domain-containing protein [Micromonospora sp. NPDC049301]|uniref:SCP2 sterol-binding domain-containing protein n=1 Tax=Micromonospora sp. NPDC049301 TaxID=3155723 RepID=UPI003422C248